MKRTEKPQPNVTNNKNLFSKKRGFCYYESKKSQRISRLRYQFKPLQNQMKIFVTSYQSVYTYIVLMAVHPLYYINDVGNH